MYFEQFIIILIAFYCNKTTLCDFPDMCTLDKIWVYQCIVKNN